jgi:hypothetical protein
MYLHDSRALGHPWLIDWQSGTSHLHLVADSSVNMTPVA